jgi:type II pantothenate kinase
MKTVIGIDVGGTTTKIVGFHKAEGKAPTLVEPLFVRATDPVTSAYGAFGKFTLENKLALDDIDCVMMTGAGSSFIDKPIYSVKCERATEFSSIGYGGLYLSGLDEAMVVSMGTGTAMVYSKREGDGVKTQYLGGTGVGGGTLVGLSRKILGVDNIDHIEGLCEGGNLDNIDLRIKDISNLNRYNGVDESLTAANFGKLSDIASKHDIALGIANMVSETIGMVAIFAARNYSLKNIVLTGNLTVVKPIRERLLGMGESFGVNFIIPEQAQFATVIGAALQSL